MERDGRGPETRELKPLDYFCAHSLAVLRLHMISWNNLASTREKIRSCIPETFTSTLISCGADGRVYLRSFSDLRTDFLLCSVKGKAL